MEVLLNKVRYSEGVGQRTVPDPFQSADADEMWTQAISSIHGGLRVGSDGAEEISFVDRYLAADVTHT